jgi:predicted DNA-binding transcriptional regulator AlpA
MLTEGFQGQKMIDEKAVAALLSVSVKVIQAWRYNRKGPRYSKLGRCIRYALGDIQDYILQNQVRHDG